MRDGSLWLIKCDNSGSDFTWSLDKYYRGPKKKGIAFEISDIKFSPDDSKCAIGAHDGLVRIYNTEPWKMKGKLKGNTSTVTHLDWSVDGSYLHTNSTSYDLLFFDVNNMRQDPGGATNTCDEHWHTWTCILGWPVHEIWRPCEDGTDINMMDRSHNKTVGNSKNPGHHVLCRADDFGKVSLLKYPCIMKGYEYNEGKGHSSHVTSCKFSLTDKYLFTSGGDDNCVIQWNIVNEKFEQTKQIKEEEEIDSEEEVEDDDEDEEMEEGSEEDEEEEEGIVLKKASAKNKKKVKSDDYEETDSDLDDNYAGFE